MEGKEEIDLRELGIDSEGSELEDKIKESKKRSESKGSKDKIERTTSKAKKIDAIKANDEVAPQGSGLSSSPQEEEDDKMEELEEQDRKWEEKKSKLINSIESSNWYDFKLASEGITEYVNDAVEKKEEKKGKSQEEQKGKDKGGREEKSEADKRREKVLQQTKDLIVNATIEVAREYCSDIEDLQPITTLSSDNKGHDMHFLPLHSLGIEVVHRSSIRYDWRTTEDDLDSFNDYIEWLTEEEHLVFENEQRSDIVMRFLILWFLLQTDFKVDKREILFAKDSDSGKTVIEFLLEAGHLRFLQLVENIMNEGAKSQTEEEKGKTEKKVYDLNSIRDSDGNNLLMQVLLRERQKSEEERTARAQSIEMNVAFFLLNQLKLNPLETNNKGEIPIIFVAQYAYPPRYIEESEANTDYSDIMDNSDDASDQRTKELQEIISQKRRQRSYQRMFDKMLDVVHPFSPIPVVNKSKGFIDRRTETQTECLLLGLYRRSPQSVDICLRRLESGRQFDGEKSFLIKYNFALTDDSEKWFNFITCTFCCCFLNAEKLKAREAKRSILQVLDSENGYILRNNAIRAMMRAFWENAIRRAVVFEMTIFLLFLLSASVLISVGIVHRDSYQNSIYVSTAVSLIVIMFALLMLSLEFLHMLQQGRAYLRDYWNYPDWIASLAIMYIAARLLWEQFQLHEREKELFAVAILYLWMKCLEYAGCFESTSSIARLFLMMLRALVQYLLVILLFVLAFGHSLFILMGNIPDGTDGAEDFSNILFSIIRMYRGLMGDSLPYDSMKGASWLGAVLYIAFTLSGILLLVNMIIALMTSVFDEVKENIETAFLINRAAFISKKLRVYIVSRNSKSFSWMQPRLTEQQIELDKLKEETEGAAKTKSKFNLQHTVANVIASAIYGNQGYSKLNDKVKVGSPKWKHFIRATLFLPDPDSYFENDWDGVVIDTKELSFLDISQMQWSEIKSEISTLRLKMNDRMTGLEKKQKKSKDLLNQIQHTMLISQSIDKIRSHHSEVRQNAVEALASVKDITLNEEQSDKVIAVVLSEALLDPDKNVVLKALETIINRKGKDNIDKFKNAFAKLLEHKDNDLVIQACRGISELRLNYPEIIEALKRRVKIDKDEDHSENESDKEVSKECVLTLCTLEIFEKFMITYLQDVVSEPPLRWSGWDEKERIKKLDTYSKRLKTAVTAIVILREKNEVIILKMINALKIDDVPPEVKESIIDAFGRLAPFISKNITPKDEQTWVQACIEANVCTLVGTGTTMPSQEMFGCKACDLYDDGNTRHKCVCVVCKNVCHGKSAEHPEPASEKAPFQSGFCDCGARGPAFCKSLPKYDEETVKNITEIVIQYANSPEEMFSSFSFASKRENQSQKANKLQAVACLALGHIGYKNETIARTLLKSLTSDDSKVTNAAREAISQLGEADISFAKLIVDEIKQTTDNRTLEKIYFVLGELNIKDSFVVKELLKGLSYRKSLAINQASFRSLKRLELLNEEVYKKLIDLHKQGTRKQISLVEEILGGSQFPISNHKVINYLNEVISKDGDDNKEIKLYCAIAILRQDKIKACLDRGICTFTVTGRSYPEQEFTGCETCEGLRLPYSGLCMSCIKTCHSDHKLESEIRKGGFFCDCGDRGEELCKGLKVPDEFKNLFKVAISVVAKALLDPKLKDDQKQTLYDAIRLAPTFAIQNEELSNALIKVIEKEQSYDLFTLLRNSVQDPLKNSAFISLLISHSDKWFAQDLLIEIANGSEQIAVQLLKRLNEKIDNSIKSAIINTAARIKAKNAEIFGLLTNVLLSAKDDDARDANEAWGSALSALGEINVNIKDAYPRMQQVVANLVNISFFSNYYYSARVTLTRMVSSVDELKPFLQEILKSSANKFDQGLLVKEGKALTTSEEKLQALLDLFVKEDNDEDDDDDN